jgi:hypothetical protein
MNIQQIRNNSSYLFYCKQYYFLKINPADSKSRNSKEYKTLVEIAKLYFENNMQSDFASYLMEYQYIVQLWTAHLILEYGNPDKELKTACLDEIKNYSETPLDKELASQEKIWLNNYYEQTGTIF